MRVPVGLETTRLFFRQPKSEDAEWIFESYAQDTDVTRYLTWQPHKNIDETRAFLARCDFDWKSEIAFPLVITRKDNGEPIGMVEIRINGFKADIGYLLTKKEWGKGYMTEAVQKIVDWALGQEEIYRVWAVCDIDNSPSARVMEKVGMKREGILGKWIMHPNISDEPRDCYCYSLVK